MKLFFRIIMVGAVIFYCCSCGNVRSGGWGRASAGGDGDFEVQESARQYVDTAMGTVIQQTVYASEETASAFFQEAMALLTGLEQEELSWRLDTSEVWQINASAGNEEGCSISEEMEALLQECLELYGRSGGAFDITLGPLTRLWNIDKWAAGGEEVKNDFRPPSAEELRYALGLCGSDRVRLVPAVSEGEEARIFLPEGMQLDLGAVGKGLALSRLSGLLEEEAGVSGAVISLGGSILTFGGKPDGSSWKVGIVNPFDTSSNVGILSLEGQWCVSTSGDYERYVEADGVRYHHILNPDTGYPAESEVRGVSILTKDGLLSDGLSTACFLLGSERGMELAEEYGVEVLFVLSDGSIVMSEGMEAYFTEL